MKPLIVLGIADTLTLALCAFVLYCAHKAAEKAESWRSAATELLARCKAESAGAKQVYADAQHLMQQSRELASERKLTVVELGKSQWPMSTDN